MDSVQHTPAEFEGILGKGFTLCDLSLMEVIGRRRAKTKMRVEKRKGNKRVLQRRREKKKQKIGNQRGFTVYHIINVKISDQSLIYLDGILIARGY